MVEPKQKALTDAQIELKAAQDKLDFLNNKILVNFSQIQRTIRIYFLQNISFTHFIFDFFLIWQEIEFRLNSIQNEFQTAIAEKTKLEAAAEQTTLTISLAHRLVNGLGSEAIRWHQSVEQLNL